MIYKTREQKLEALQDVEIKGGRILGFEVNEFSGDFDHWEPLLIEHCVGVLSAPTHTQWHIRKVEPKKITAFDLAGMWMTCEEWPSMQRIEAINKDGSGVYDDEEWVTLDDLSKHTFSKDHKTPLSEWKTLKQMEAEL